jgi:phosphoribosylaminoimidazolecarboxamide formyltransferase / IMP cyclohydrolase
MLRARRALLSVSDKTGLVDFARGLAELGIEILSTGGTAQLLRLNDIPVVEVAQHTGFPEMMEGRVKTLHPRIHGGILARRDNEDHLRAMQEHGIPPIDMVVVNLYPFEQAVARPGCTMDEAIENIDIGGPAMVRAAAKNHAFVAVVTDPADYSSLLDKMRRSNGKLPLAERYALAAKAFSHTAEYDGMISNWLTARNARDEARPFPDRLNVQLRLAQSLRYGENPHQQGALYRPADAAPVGLAALKQLQGKELSYNNYLDMQAAYGLASAFKEGAAVVVKHLNPCGVGFDENMERAYRRALAADPVSAFGGIVALSRAVDAATAAALAETFLEAVIAPGFEAGALEALRGKKSLRLLEVPMIAQGREAWSPEPRELRSVPGGLLVQSRDLADADPRGWKLVTRREATPEELEALAFAWSVVKHVKSNAIVLARRDVTVGIGMGQTNRVDSVRIAAERAGDKARGAALASDAFFPFPDGVEAAAAAGVTAVAQPGGSVRDDEVIAAADKLGLAMLFTGVRHFRH